MVVVGVTRRIDDLGRITIPSEIRKTYQLDKNDPVEIIGTEDGILLRVPNIRIQSELASIEADIENAVFEERKEAESLQAMEQIVALSEINDDLLASKMYDDIEMIVVQDNSTLDIKWKFDVDYSKSYP